MAVSFKKFMQQIAGEKAPRTHQRASLSSMCSTLLELLLAEPFGQKQTGGKSKRWEMEQYAP